MFRRVALVLFLLVIVFFAFPRSASLVSPQHLQFPPDFPRDLTAGRAGTFHFVTNEQLRADRADLADLRVGIDRLQRLLPTLRDPTAQRDIANELERWSLHVARLEQRMNSSAGATAATVEAHLNRMKGQSNCAMCHGSIPDAPMRTVY